MTKTNLQQVSFAGSPIFTMGRYRPVQKLEKLVAHSMKLFSNYSYFPEVIIGDKMNGKSFRVDGVIPELKQLISVRSQKVGGSVDDKLLTEIQSLQDACEDHQWQKAVLVIDDPNNNMSWGQAYLTKNKTSRCYKRNQERYPNVEIIDFGDFASRYFNRLDV